MDYSKHSDSQLATIMVEVDAEKKRRAALAAVPAKVEAIYAEAARLGIDPAVIEDAEKAARAKPRDKGSKVQSKKLDLHSPAANT